MEPASGSGAAVTVDRHHRVGRQRVGHRGTLVYARTHSVVIAARHRGAHAQRVQGGPDPQRGVPRERVLGVAALGVGAAGLAVLGAAAAGGYLAGHGRVIGTVVAWIQEHDHARDAARHGVACWCRQRGCGE